MWIWSLGREDTTEEATASHSSLLAWRSPWTEDPGRPQSIGAQSWTWLKWQHTHCIVGKARELQKDIYHSFIDCTKALTLDHSKLRKILKELGISDRFTWLLRNLYAGQETTVRNRRGTTDWFKTGEGAHPDHILSPCLFNLYADFTKRNAGLGESQAGPRFPGEISTTSGMPMKPL